ncbi:MAG: ATP-binding protein [Armatimonadetes bacterium]|nr:ATP-binding protein [Armatimonadota bacterium]MDE2205954.1 ATP-binding protein [Armatimonadota bacterium]
MADLPPVPLEDLLHEGMQRARVYNWNSAIEFFRGAVAADAENVEARFRLGWALWNLAEAEKPTLADLAVAYGAHVLGFDETARDGKRRYRAYRQNLNDAAHYLKSVTSRDPAHARAWHYLGRTLQALERRPEAAEAARKAAELEPANTGYRGLARSLEGIDSVAPETTPREPLTWADLVVNDKTKRELRQVQLMMEKPELAQQLGVQPPTGLLLKGPPGTGKTTIARVLAHEAKCSFYSITPADIHQMYVGESEKRVRDLFARARATPPAIIFIDEVDALLPMRQGGVAIHSDKVVNQFLQEMDGLTRNERVLVIAATNRPDMLDPALRRGGRLSREIEIPMPEANGRLQLLQLCTRSAQLDDDVELDELVRITDGYSGADIRALVDEAGLQALIRIADGDENQSRSLTLADFRTALENLG